jgi:hypothetical protein
MLVVMAWPLVFPKPAQGGQSSVSAVEDRGVLIQWVMPGILALALVTAGILHFAASRAKLTAPPPVRETIAGREFKDQIIVLDNKTYIDCSFTNPRFAWKGAPFSIIRGTLIGSRHLEVAHSQAAEVIDLLKYLGFLSPAFAASWTRKHVNLS